MRNSARRKLIVALLGVTFSLLLAESLLALLDPLGFAYYRDQMALSALLVPDPRGYALRAGFHDLSAFDFTILPDGTRAVPDTHPEVTKKLVFVGDSVTFGYGVADAQTWVNLIARARPDLHAINAGVSGYNSTNVRRTIARYPDADAFVYLIIDNDAEPEKQVDFSRLRPPDNSSWLALYLLNLPEYLNPPTLEPLDYDLAGFFADLAAIHADDRVRLVAFDDAFGRMIANSYPAVGLIARPADRVSSADGHPGVRGNAEIAAQILPLLPT